MTTDPDQLRAEIDRTRANLSNDVDALTEHVAPKNVAKRQADKVKGAVGGVKDRVMGKADDLVDAVTDKTDDLKGAVSHKAGDVRASGAGAAGGAGDVAGRVGDRASDVAGRAGDVAGRVGDRAGDVAGRAGDVAGRVGDAASQAPAKLRSASAGNPLAAGLIALGAGWLVASLIPASSKEQQLASTVKDSAGALAAPVKERAQGVAQDVAGNIKSSAVDAVLASVKATAAGAVGTAKDGGTSTAKHV
jgi:uncharacterized protein YjbJ (UPF0337 family)